MINQTNNKPEVKLKQLKVSDELTIVKAKPEDAEKIYKELDKSRDDMKEWLDFAKNATFESTKEYLEKSINTERNKRDGFKILYKNKFVGMIGIVKFNREEDWCEIGYWLSSNYTGKGIMTKCSRILIDYIFDELDFNTAIIKCDKRNKKSAGVAERLRYDAREEILNEEFQGKIRDSFIHKFYRESWKNRNKTLK